MATRLQGEHLTRVCAFLFVIGMIVSASAAASERLTLIGNVGGFVDELQELTKQFTERTGIEVDIMSRGWPDTREQTTVMVAGGTPPDVVYTNSYSLVDLGRRGLLASLDSMIDRDGVDLAVYPDLLIKSLRGISGNGTLLSLPTSLSNRMIYLNVSMFEEAGLALPPSDWEAPGWDWNEFVTVARTLTQDVSGDGIPDRYGITFNQPPEEWLGLFDLDWVSDDGTRYLGAQAPHIAAMELILSLFTEHQAATRGLASFRQGNAGMVYIAAHMLNNLRGRPDAYGFPWSIAVQPRIVKRAVSAEGLNLSVIEESRNKDAAWELVKFLAYETDGARQFGLAENRLAVHRDLAHDFIERWNSWAPGSRPETFLASFNHLWFHQLEVVGGLIGEARLAVLDEELPVATAFRQIEPAANALLQQAHR